MYLIDAFIQYLSNVLYIIGEFQEMRKLDLKYQSLQQKTNALNV